jgi:(p)ppGpp synthase/HD superfamily hydrolase
MIDRALEVASVAHRGQVRKGTDTPYISHPAAVALMLARAGCPDEVIAAGILHDTVEDTNITLEDIRATFGEHVAAIVEGCSEPEKGAPWEHRKTHTLEYLRTAPYEVRVVSCADKLHNLRTIADGYTTLGESIWERFKRGRAEQAWYYHGLADVLCTPRPGNPEIPFCQEFRALVDHVFGQ